MVVVKTWSIDSITLLHVNSIIFAMWTWNSQINSKEGKRQNFTKSIKRKKNEQLQSHVVPKSSTHPFFQSQVMQKNMQKKNFDFHSAIECIGICLPTNSKKRKWLWTAQKEFSGHRMSVQCIQTHYHWTTHSFMCTIPLSLSCANEPVNIDVIIVCVRIHFQKPHEMHNYQQK